VKTEQTVLAVPSSRLYAWVLPDVGTVTPVLAQLDVIPVFGVTALEDKHQLVATAIK
jgi:hypothetical protein